MSGPGGLERPVDLVAGDFIVGRMSAGDQDPFELGRDSLPEPQSKMGLTIKSGGREALSPAQMDFNKRTVALEKGRADYERERVRLNGQLQVCMRELMPLIEKANRAELEMIDALQQTAESVKLTSRRRSLLEDWIVEKADGLLVDPVGLNEEQIAWLESLGRESGDEGNEELEKKEWDRLRAMMKEFGRRAGVKLDLEGVDFSGDPAEVMRQVEERFVAAGGAFAQGPGAKAGAGSKPKPKRKPSKAAIKRERLKQELEEAKKRDFKSLYKQLAKVLHPDLETDPEMKAHKEEWMKRLTTAQAGGDLRDMLAIEMEWLGEEAGNLSKATDEKLRVYAMVLKEQLADLKTQTQMMIREPQYDPILRFLDPGGRLSPQLVKAGLSEEIEFLQQFTQSLRAGGTKARLTINQIADDFGRMFG